MTRYELACDKRITLTAIVFEVLMLISCVLLTDSVLVTLAEHYPHKVMYDPIFASHVPLVFAIWCVVVLQYLITIIEMIARFRDDTRGLTIPLVWLPGGMIVRSVLILALAILVISIKLVIYFTSVMLTFLFQIIHIDKHWTTCHLVDITDRVMEPLERYVNKLYNILYYHKIHANTSVFTSIFNGSLSLWCINH